MPGPIGPILSIADGDESEPSPIELGTGLPSGPNILPPRGELSIPGSRFPMEPSPESGPGPMELGVEQGVDTWVSCCDICAIEVIGSNPLPAWLEGTEVEVGVEGLSGMLSCGGRPPMAMWLGDIPPGNLPPGLPGIGNRGLLSGPGEGAGNALGLSCELGVWGVPGIGPPPGVWSPVYMFSLVGVWGAQCLVPTMQLCAALESDRHQAAPSCACEHRRGLVCRNRCVCDAPRCTPNRCMRYSPNAAHGVAACGLRCVSVVAKALAACTTASRRHNYVTGASAAA